MKIFSVLVFGKTLSCIHINTTFLHFCRIAGLESVGVGRGPGEQVCPVTGCGIFKSQ